MVQVELTRIFCLGNASELTGWDLIGTYWAGTVAVIVTWPLALMIMLSCVIAALGAEQELPLKKGKLWAPGLEWKLKDPLHSGNPFDLVVTVTFRHENGMETRETKMFYNHNNVWKFRFLGTKTGRWTFDTTSEDPDLNGWYGSSKLKRTMT